MKTKMVKLIAGAAFLAAGVAGNAGAADHQRPALKEIFMDIGRAMGEACTKDANSIQYVTDFGVSFADLQVKGMEGSDFVEKYATQISANMKTIWNDVASGYTLSELQTDRAKLNEMSDKLNAAQEARFDKFEAETGITVRTDTSEIGTRKGCTP